MSKRFVTATIAQDAALSAAVPIGHTLIVGIIMPAQWTTADLTFQGSLGDTAFVELQDLAQSAIPITAFTVSTPAAAKLIPIDPMTFAACAALKIRSGTAATPVNQAAARTIKLVTIDLDD